MSEQPNSIWLNLLKVALPPASSLTLLGKAKTSLLMISQSHRTLIIQLNTKNSKNHWSPQQVYHIHVEYACHQRHTWQANADEWHRSRTTAAPITELVSQWRCITPYRSTTISFIIIMIAIEVNQIIKSVSDIQPFAQVLSSGRLDVKINNSPMTEPPLSTPTSTAAQKQIIDDDSWNQTSRCFETDDDPSVAHKPFSKPSMH